MTFEEAQKELERIVHQLESGQADLDEAITLWERGEELYRLCSDKLDSAIQEVWDVHVKAIEGRFGEKGLTYGEFVERADDRGIRTGFEAAKKAFGADIAQSYVNHLAGPARRLAEESRIHPARRPHDDADVARLHPHQVGDVLRDEVARGRHAAQR